MSDIRTINTEPMQDHNLDHARTFRKAPYQSHYSCWNDILLAASRPPLPCDGWYPVTSPPPPDFPDFAEFDDPHIASELDFGFLLTLPEFWHWSHHQFGHEVSHRDIDLLATGRMSLIDLFIRGPVSPLWYDRLREAERIKEQNGHKKIIKVINQGIRDINEARAAEAKKETQISSSCKAHAGNIIEETGNEIKRVDGEIREIKRDARLHLRAQRAAGSKRTPQTRFACPPRVYERSHLPEIDHHEPSREQRICLENHESQAAPVFRLDGKPISNNPRDFHIESAVERMVRFLFKPDNDLDHRQFWDLIEELANEIRSAYPDRYGKDEDIEKRVYEVSLRIRKDARERANVREESERAEQAEAGPSTRPRPQLQPSRDRSPPDLVSLPSSKDDVDQGPQIGLEQLKIDAKIMERLAGESRAKYEAARAKLEGTDHSGVEDADLHAERSRSLKRKEPVRET